MTVALAEGPPDEGRRGFAERDSGFALDAQDFDWGSDYCRRHGVMMPADGADRLRAFDAILFGAVGAPDIPDHITLWGLRLAICQPLDQYANVRPTRILPGITSPLRHVAGPELDWVIVRENSEGEYSGVGGRAQGLPIEVAQDVSVMTRAGVQRIMRYAFRLAQSRPHRRCSSRSTARPSTSPARASPTRSRRSGPRR